MSSSTEKQHDKIKRDLAKIAKDNGPKSKWTKAIWEDYGRLMDKLETVMKTKQDELEQAIQAKTLVATPPPDHADPTDKTAGADAGVTPGSELKVDDEVVVTGLKKKPQFNKRVATVEGYDAEKQKYKVRFGDATGPTMYVKAQNLKKSQWPSAAAAQRAAEEYQPPPAVT